MFKKNQNSILIQNRSNWRNYQMGLQRSAANRRSFRTRIKYTVVFITLMLGLYTVIGGFGGMACQQKQGMGPVSFKIHQPPPEPVPKVMVKKQVRSLLETKPVVNLKQKSFDIVYEGQNLNVETSLEMPLQRFIIDHLQTDTSRYIGIVAMEPTTGKILAMVSFDKNDSANNLCIDSRFPAASVFKIVTAAAAIEKYNFDSATPMTYNGRKYTLYKSQLKETNNKWTRKIMFKDSFAQSINPVFGKIGSLYLGKSALEKYGQAFGFNDQINFELQMTPSTLSVSDDPYQLAEIASGFNRRTRISPIHGAMMVSAVMNQGNLVEPTIIDQIVDESGTVLYKGQSTTIRQTIKPQASRIMHRLMAETIKSGTGRKIFKGFRRDKTLSRLNIGGKTGSIHNESHETRFDWFVGFAEDRNGSEKLVLSVVVGHEKYIGIRAGKYAQMAMKEYFKNYFTEMERRKTDS